MSAVTLLQSIASVNPATAEVLKTFDPISGSELDRRLAVGANAFKTYRRAPIAERTQPLFNAAGVEASCVVACREQNARSLGLRPEAAALGITGAGGCHRRLKA